MGEGLPAGETGIANPAYLNFFMPSATKLQGGSDIMHWIDSGGGPLILISETQLPAWGGIRQNPSSPMTDYERACAVDGYLALLECGEGDALVLGDEPLSTAFFQSEAESLLVRWEYADSEQSVLDAVQELPIRSESGELTIALGGNYLLFDAAEPGDDIVGDRLLIEFAPGVYEVGTERVSPEARVSLVVHRFRKVA